MNYSGRLKFFFGNCRRLQNILFNCSYRFLNSSQRFSLVINTLGRRNHVRSWTAALSLFTVAAMASSLDNATLEKVIAEADSLYSALQYDQVYNLLLKYKDVRSDELKWRLARAIYKMSTSTTKDEKVKLLKEAKEIVFEALEINQENFASHKWAAILVVELAEQEGTKAKIQQSVVSKEHMLKAHQLNPKDGTTLYLLGVWCFSFAELTWSQRKLASLIFATPPTSTFEEALEYFLEAEKGEPNFYSMNLLMLGKTYLQLKDKDKAVHYLKLAQNYPQRTDEDKQAVADATKLLKGLGF